VRQEAENLVLRQAAAAVSAEHAIVDLGAWRGHGTEALANGSEEGESATVFAIDIWGLEPTGQGELYDDPENQDRFLARLERHVASGLVVPARLHTTEAAKLWSRPIGLLVIDADHRYAGCRADYEGWSPWVVPGGMLAVHDYKNPTWPGVDKLVEVDIRPSGLWEQEKFVEPFLLTFRRKGQ